MNRFLVLIIGGLLALGSLVSLPLHAQEPPTATPVSPSTTPEPPTAIGTPVPTPILLPTLLPDQTFTALTIHSQAVTHLATKPAGITIIALLFLWGGLWLLTKR